MQEDNSMTFDQMYRTYESLVRRYLHRIVDNREDAEELMQDVFIKLWQNNDKLTDKASYINIFSN